MNSYKCTVTDKSGKTKSLIRNGNSEQDIINSFSNTEYIPLKIQLQQNHNKHTLSKNSKNVLEFTAIMEQLLASGLSIKDSLEVSTIINKKKKKTEDISSNIFEKIQKGTSFAAAVNEMPQTFSPVYRGIISVGDKVGSVEKIFPRLRLYLETQKKIKDKLLGSLIYPAIVLTTAFLTFIAMIFFVFPKLKLMFEDFGGDAAIQLQNNISKMEIIFIVLISIVLIFFIFIMIIAFFSKKNVNLKLKKDNFILKLPIIGNFSTYFETLNFSFAMETLTAGGVTIENAINESKSVISNEKYKQSLTEVNKRILKGEPLSEAFSNYKVFPEYMTKWLYVGERSGKTEQVFSQIRNYFQNEIDLYTTKFMTLVEPTLIIIIGIFLVIFVLIIIVPVFSLYGSIL